MKYERLSLEILIEKYEYASFSNYTQGETKNRLYKSSESCAELKNVDLKQNGVRMKNSKMVWGLSKIGLFG